MLRTPLHALLVLVLAAGPVHAAAPDAGPPEKRPLAIVINRENPIESLSNDEVRAFFSTRRQFWEGGVRVTVVFQRPDSVAEQQFMVRVLQEPQSDLDQAFLQKRYRGVLIAEIKVAASAAEVRAIVSSTRGAVGFVWGDEADETVAVAHSY